MLECIGNTYIGLMTSQSVKITICSVKNKNPPQHTISTHISNVQVLNDQVLFLCWAWMDQGG